MADVKITELSEATTPTPDDLLVAVDAPGGSAATKKISFNNAFKLPGAAGLTAGTYMGFTISGIAAGETITQWMTVFLDDTENEWMKANAAASAHFPARGLAVAAGSNGNALDVLVLGVVHNDSWTWTGEGKTLYLGETEGAITETAPSTSGDCVQVIGFSLSATEAFFNFTGHYLEL